MTRKRIAIVEDNEDNLLLLHAILEETYDLVEYRTGTEALAGLIAHVPDLVLMDISLPGMDGPEVLAHLRAALRTEAPPVVALTAHVMSGDRESLMRSGFDEYIAKPILDEGRLFEIIEDQVARFRPANPTSTEHRGESLP